MSHQKRHPPKGLLLPSDGCSLPIPTGERDPKAKYDHGLQRTLRILKQKGIEERKAQGRERKGRGRLREELDFLQMRNKDS